ncbi:lysozyme inhibitor LprI family protein, partial [Ralstonia pseudosolanacearum]
MRARACVAAALAVLAAPIALAGTLEACRTAPPEAGGAARCVQAARKSAQAELAAAESARRN